MTARRPSLEPEPHSPVDGPVRREAGGGEDDVAREGGAVEVPPQLEPESQAGPQAAVRVGGRGVDLRRVLVHAAVHLRVAGKKELCQEELPALAEQMAARKADLQAGKAAPGAQLQ